MPRDNSVFHAMTRPIDWNAFDMARDRHGKVVPRDFTDKSRRLTLLYPQFTSAPSLRPIEAGPNSHAARLHRLGGRLWRAPPSPTPT